MTRLGTHFPATLKCLKGLFQVAGKIPVDRRQPSTYTHSLEIRVLLRSLQLCNFKSPPPLGGRGLFEQKPAILFYLPNTYLDFQLYLSATLMRNVDRINLLWLVTAGFAICCSFLFPYLFLPIPWLLSIKNYPRLLYLIINIHSKQIPHQWSQKLEKTKTFFLLNKRL